LQIGIDSFAAAIPDPITGVALTAAERMDHLLQEITLADQAGLDVFGIGEQAADDFFPGYAHTFTEIGKERGWPPTTRAQFDALRGPTGALIIGDPETVAKKIFYINEALGGITRITFQMGVSTLPHAKMMHAIELLGERVSPMVREELSVIAQ